MDVRSLQDFSSALQRALWGMASLSLLGVVSFVVLDHPTAQLRSAVFMLLTGGSALVLRRPGTLPIIGHTLVGGTILTILSSVLKYGILSSMLPILPLLGPVAVFTGGRKSGLAWSSVSMGVLFLALACSPFDEPAVEVALFICSTGAVGLSSWITISFWSVTRAQAERLRATNVALRIEQEASLAASRAKSTFLATMSHEIRTPPQRGHWPVGDARLPAALPGGPRHRPADSALGQPAAEPGQ